MEISDKTLDSIGDIIESEFDRYSMMLFGKHGFQLSFEDKEKMLRYLKDKNNPVWREIKCKNDTMVEVNRIGEVRNVCSKKVYAQYTGTYKGSEYRYIYIQSPNKKSVVRQSVHRLVAQAFIPNPENKPEVNHINGNKHCNWVENLEWVTHKENSNHAVRIGLIRKTLSDEQVKKVCDLIMENPNISFVKLANETGVPHNMIQYIYRKKVWHHITDDYYFPKHRRVVGTDNPKCKYTEKQIEDICKILDDNTNKLTQREIANKFNVTKRLVEHISDGTQWTNISSKHPFYKRKFENDTL